MKPFARFIRLGLLASSPAIAATGPVPLQKDICVNGIVDKNKLATFLFDANAVSRPFEDAQAALHPPRSGLSSRVLIIADTRLCTSGEPCSDPDRDAFDGMVVDLRNLLKEQGQAYGNETGVTSVSDYLTKSSARLVCLQRNGKPVEAVGAPSGPSAKSWSPPFRVRASGEDVDIGSSDSAFRGLNKATVSFAHDTSKATEKVVGAIGFPFEFDGPNNSKYALVPYAGMNWSSLTRPGHGTVVDPQTYDFGVSMDLRNRVVYAPPGAASPFILTNWITARPDLLFDNSDGSQLLSFNLKYTPVINTVRTHNGYFAVNDYIKVIPGFLSVSPLLDARFDNGWYVDRGTSPGNADYSRLGGRVGLALTSDDNNLPLDLTVSETFLKTLAGSTSDVNYFSAVLSLGLDPARKVGIDFSYTTGTREDTDQRVDAWSIAFGAKY